MNKYIKLVVSIVLSGAGLYYAFRKIDFVEFWTNLLQIDWILILIAIVLMIYSVLVRAQRWQLILEPVKLIKINPLFGSTMIGYFGNSILPFRMGELLRGYSIGKSQSISISAAFGTIILERIIDMLGLIVVIIVFMYFYPLPDSIKAAMYVITTVSLLLLFLILVVGKKPSIWKDRLESLGFLKYPFGKKMKAVFANLIDGVISIVNTKHIVAIILYTLFLWMIYYIYMYLVVLACKLDISWIAVGILLISTTLSISIPAAPGYIGTYHAVAVYVLVSFFSIEMTEAQAFAVIIHAVGYIPFVIVGSYYFVRSSLHISEVKIETFAE